MNNGRMSEIIAGIADNKFLESIIKHIPSGICIYIKRGSEYVCITSNAYYSELTGTPASELAGENILKISERIHPNDLERFKNEFSSFMHNHMSFSSTFRIVNKSTSQYQWVQLDGEFVDVSKDEKYVYITFTNVDTMQKIEEALEQNRIALQSIVKHVPGGVFVYSAESDETFTFVSENMLSMLGYTREEFDKKFDCRFSNMVYKEDRERVLKEIWRQIDAGAFDTCTYRIEKKDGTLLWVHDEGHIVTDEHGKKWFYVVVVDITDSVMQEKNLAIKNIELNRLIDNIPVSIVVYKKLRDEFKVEAVNGYLHRLSSELSKTLLLMSKKDIMSLVHPDDRQSIKEFFNKLYSCEQSTSEITYRTSTDTTHNYKWYHCSAIRNKEIDGSITIYAVYTDATYQKIKEKEFNRIIRELLTSNPNALCSFRINITKNICSDGYGKSEYIEQLLSAKTADDLLENIAGIITDENEAQNFRNTYNREMLKKHFEEGKDQFSVTYHRAINNGEFHWVTTYFHVVQNPYTNDLEAFAYSVDSDYECKKEKIISIITSEEYDFIGLLNLCTEDVAYYYVTGKDKAMKSTLPKSFKQAIDFVSGLMLTNEDKEEFLKTISTENIRNKLKDNELFLYTASCRNSKNKICRKQISFRYIDSGSDEVMFAMADITATFEHEEDYTNKLRKALMLAEKANQLKTDFLGNVSHDMRTPLNGILGYSHLVSLSDNVDEIKGYNQKINIAGNMLLSLINDTLDLQKIENGTIELKPEPVYCADAINEILTSIQPLIDNKKIHFNFDKDKTAFATINIDILRVKEIFINLLSNAIKFTPENGSVELVVECQKIENNRLYDKIVVRDNGIGMSKEFQQKMFEPFSQERADKKAVSEGSGLGLTIVKRLVEMMNGEIYVKSTLGKGTEVTVMLTFEIAAKKANGSVQFHDEAQRLDGIKVLLCEDNVMNSEIAKRILENAGAKVDIAMDGVEGCKAFERSPCGTYDIILMDIRMPNMDGYDASKRIRSASHKQSKTIPIIAMTADAYSSDVEKAFLNGMNGHIAKPFVPNKLISEILHQVQN